MEYVVYSITCINTNRVYFGRSQEVDKRWRAHKNMLRRGLHNNTVLQKEWLLYGEDNFKFEILHRYENISEAEAREQEYIDDCSYDKYNISDAGDGGDTFSNNPRQDEIRKLKSISSSGKNNPMYGKPKSELTIRRIKEANSKKIFIDGIPYDSLTKASKELGLGVTTISYRLNSKTFTEWKYAN
ncbi:GIY-YIG nuclease family protein [Niallia alba]|uniref:GIY-YIG nuclease family protein n=1 Tax=Niallia alba TaxID=2729105 RepID=UPI002E1CE51F|nr:GIY-YIG nuclease family protein [Niallia alba]